jgi:hypothetical protein
MSKQDSSFCEQKEAKKLHSFGPGASTPRAQKNKSFLLLFFKKEDLPSLGTTP